MGGFACLGYGGGCVLGMASVGAREMSVAELVDCGRLRQPWCERGNGPGGCD